MNNNISVEVKGIVFNKVGEFGDFNWMIEQDEYDDCLFLFNDNLEYHFTNKKGAGNAIIRKHNIYNKSKLNDKPRSFGIPTGTLKDGGFSELTIEVEFIIDKCFEHLTEIIKKYNYKKIYFSKDKEKNKLGTSIFEVNPEVIDYITEKIFDLQFI